MQSQNPYLAVALLALALTQPTGHALAEKADKQKPINIEADSMRHDDVAKVSVWSGRVIMTKGTILMRAQQIDVKEDLEGNQFAVAIAKPGERVFFRQKREGHDEFMEGEALRVEYDGKADIVTFDERAVVRRLKGATLSDESTGKKIVFDNAKETLTMTGAPAANGKAPERVRAMLSPKESKDTAKDAVSKPDSAIPANSTATTPPAVLKASPALKP